MSADWFAFLVAVAVFGAGLFGLFLQRLLPEHHTSGGSRDMIAAVVGLLARLCALVSGSWFGRRIECTPVKNAQIQTVGSTVMQLDLALVDFGRQSDPFAASRGLAKTIDQVWRASQSDSNFAADNFAAALQNVRARERPWTLFTLRSMTRRGCLPP